MHFTFKDGVSSSFCKTPPPAERRRCGIQEQEAEVDQEKHNHWKAAVTPRATLDSMRLGDIVAFG
jgi:hypothetical protein